MVSTIEFVIGTIILVAFVGLCLRNAFQKVQCPVTGEEFRFIRTIFIRTGFMTEHLCPCHKVRYEISGP